MHRTVYLSFISGSALLIIVGVACLVGLAVLIIGVICLRRFVLHPGYNENYVNAELD